MTIDQKQTVYKRDYTWPLTQSKPPPEGIQVFAFCPCNLKKDTHNPAPKANEQGWSRIGPMGPLIDPKLYPAHVGATPQSEVSRFDQPNIFLSKLQQKYPLIFDCGGRKPNDFLAKINRERLRSTYQVDFCKDAPMRYEDLVRTGGADGYASCPAPKKLPGDPCKPYQKLIAYRPNVISNRPGGPNLKGDDLKPRNISQCVGSCRAGPLTSGATEYQDTISKLGAKLMPEKTKKKRI